jgi:hypothetical protein
MKIGMLPSFLSGQKLGIVRHAAAALSGQKERVAFGPEYIYCDGTPPRAAFASSGSPAALRRS